MRAPQCAPGLEFDELKWAAGGNCSDQTTSAGPCNGHELWRRDFAQSWSASYEFQSLVDLGVLIKHRRSWRIGGGLNV